MPEYFYNNNLISEERVNKAAENLGLSVDDYIKEHGFQVKEATKKDNEKQDPSIGDKISNAFNAYINPFTPIQERPLYSMGVDVGEIKEKARKEGEPYKKDKLNFEKELDKAFSKNPTLFGQMIENPNQLTLQERQIEAGDFGTPEKYLLNIVKKEIGGMGLFGDRKVDEQSESLFKNLSDDDIETIIEQKFYEKLELEKTNKSNDIALNKKENIEKQGVNIRQWQNDTRKTFINSYTGINKEIADLVESINNGNLDETQRATAIKSLLEKKSKKGDGTTMLYNLNTRNFSIARDEEEAEEMQRKNKDLVDLGIDGEQAKFNDLLGRIKPENQLDYLRNEFERSALTLSAHNQKLDEVQTWSIRKSGYEMIEDPSSSRRLIKSNLRDLMRMTEFSDFAPVPVEQLRRGKQETDVEYEKRKKDLIKNWETDFKVLKQDDLNYTREFEALKRMYLLNEGIMDIEKPKYVTIIPKNMAALKQSTAAIVKPWTSDYFAQKMIGSTNRTLLDETGKVYDNLGVEKTDSEEKQLKASISENVNEGVLGMNKMLIEFGGINKVLGVTGVAARYQKLLKTLNGGKYVKNGKTYSNALVKTRAKAKGLKVDDYASSIGLRSVQSYKNKFYDVVAGGIMEAGKFELFTQFDVTKGKFKPEAGEQFGTATGFGFGAAGRIIAPLSPFLQQKGLLKDIDKSIKLASREARIGLNSRKLFETFVTQPASFVVGSEAGELTKAIVDDMLGDKQIGNYMDKHYPSYGETGQRLIVNYFTGLGLGVGHFKGFTDFKSKAAIQRNRDNAINEMQKSGRLANLTESEINNILSEKSQNKLHENLSNKNLEEFYKHYEIYDGMENKLQQLYRAEGYMDPSRADELVKQDHKQFLAEEKAAGREVKLEVVNNDKLKFQQRAIDTNKKAEILTDPKTKLTTIRYNAKLYSPDVMPHEVHHYYTEELFGQDAVFKGEFMNTLNSIGNKIKLKRLITEQEAKELGDETLKGNNMTLSQSIKLKKFDIASPTNQQRVQQWELFAHIAEQIGNKNNYFDIKNSGEGGGFVDLRNLLSTLGKTTGKKLNLSREKDVVDWFTKYAENVKKGKSVVDMFSELESVIDFEATAIRKAERLAEGRTGIDTYSSERLDLGDGRRINNPKELAKEVQKEYEAKLAEGKDNVTAYKEIADPNRRSANYDPNYPILGKKIGPMLDIALSSWNRTQAADFKINLGDRSYESKRSSIALDFLASKNRGLEDIFNKYTKDKGQLMTWVTGQLRRRMQETIERGVGKETNVRETKVGDFVEFERIFSDVDNIGGKVDKSFDNANPAVKPRGIQLKNHNFTFGERKRAINPESINNIEKTSKETFNNTKVEDFTYQKIAEKILQVTTPEITNLFGGKEGMKPKELYETQIKFIKENAPILYDSMPLTSHPKFYENTMIGKTILNRFYKNTGKKYITDELSVEEAARTNARTFKYEKLPATKERIQELVDLMQSGRDAGTNNKKINILKEHVGKVLGNQVFRDLLNKPEFKQSLDAKGLSKLESVKAELAMRKLRGATPEKLASEDLDVMNNFIKEWKGLDHGKLKYPEIRLRTMIENNKDYKRLFDTKLNVVDQIAKEMGYELREISKDVFEQVSEANRVLEKNITKIVEPRLTKNWREVEFGNEMKKLLEEKGYPKEIVNELKFDEMSWSKDRNSVIEYDTFLKDFYNELPLEIALNQILKKSAGTGAGKTLFVNEKGQVERRNNDWWSSFSKEFKGSGKKAPTWLKHVKTIKNGTLKAGINEALELSEFSDVKTNEKTQKKFANYITKKYLTNKGSTYEQVLDANQKMMEFMGEKLFDYFNKSKDKIFALNNIKRYLQIQTSIEDGFVRSLATHDAISIKRGSKHSEHEFQALNMSTNLMLNIVKNAGSKQVFLENLKPLTRIFRQSIIEKTVQAKYDAPEFGGKTGFEFVFTTETGKYSWMREMKIAENTLDLRTGKTYDKLILDLVTSSKALKAVEKLKDNMLKQVGIDSKKMSPTEKTEAMKTVDNAIALGRKRKKTARGMSTFDFDETLIDKGENFIVATKGKDIVKISSGKWPIDGPKYAEQGYRFDFKDFVNVRGGVEGPLLQKMRNQITKFGPENVFVLTARPPESATAIQAWLKSKGINIKLENITGLGNSTGEAKALWMLEKFSEGYNDMYFVDDAMPNVKAVRNVLNQLDIKSKVQQALASENLDISINKIMEHSLNIGSEKRFSKAEAKVRGKDIKRRRVFMRDSAADLELLIEPLYGKGEKGIENKKWFKDNFIMPFERGIRDYNKARQSAKNDYLNLRKQNKDVVKILPRPVQGGTFTTDMAMRVYLWNKAGFKIPDLAKQTETMLVNYIKNNPKLQAYAETFGKITKQEKGLKEPKENWWAETMAGEVTSIDRGVSRKQYLQEFIDVKNEIFNDVNLNKMESKLGTRWRENIEDMFDRMETGRTRSIKMDRGSAMMMNYLNGGIGTIMNFNTRSAVLQTISTANFLNMRENNPVSAARAMANTKQFVKDFKFIMNSDMLKQRRDGLAINVTEAELASAAAGSKNPIQSIIARVLKAGYLPTKFADSFAISFGGATFYRNRIKMYEKQGMETKAAEKKAFLDFQVLAERTQQSSRADLLSKQQTSLIGRFILPFANTPMQMNRAGMKDILDISKSRYKGGKELAEKMGRITYYMGAQVAIFAGLQSALFAMLLNDEDVSDEQIANTKSMMLNSVSDSFLRGFGIQGAVMSAFKNATQEYFKQSEKGFRADYSEVGEDLLNISPPIGSKFGMLDRAGDRLKFDKTGEGFKFELGNPSLEASLMSIQAITNAPVYSPYQNAFNLKHAMSDQYETWQRFLMATGWTPYSVGIETEKKRKKSRPGGYRGRRGLIVQ